MYVINCVRIYQDNRRYARARGVGVKAERVPRNGGEGGATQARRARLAQPARAGAAAAAREAQVEDVHERRQRHVSVARLPRASYAPRTGPSRAHSCAVWQK